MHLGATVVAARGLPYRLHSVSHPTQRVVRKKSNIMSSGRKDKRWLKSVEDPDLVSFFEDSQFDAGEYAKGFFEQREASHAVKRCVGRW